MSPPHLDTVTKKRLGKQAITELILNENVEMMVPIALMASFATAYLILLETLDAAFGHFKRSKTSVLYSYPFSRWPLSILEVSLWLDNFYGIFQ